MHQTRRNTLAASRWQALVVASVAVFLVFLVITMLNIAFPAVERSFPSSSRADLSWILTLGAALGIAILVAVVSDPDLAKASDTFDRGYLFVAMGSLLTAATTLLLERTRKPVKEPKAGVFHRQTKAVVRPREGVVTLLGVRDVG